ncbi:hypothetical protein SAMN02746065_12166 [Desulfocicer vacuolatum DSM 3385]|uniref:Uncharacterized protein n=1 Tax=Desulfocicer vacuolatum DSM 3385 TaxID=1121400 RepID=A0A1W2DX87_9BACT|nr:hypothetical protein SAMN02746065_12166 [Desulfocicer vacuolatum DSM 3385]
MRKSKLICLVSTCLFFFSKNDMNGQYHHNFLVPMHITTGLDYKLGHYIRMLKLTSHFVTKSALYFQSTH